MKLGFVSAILPEYTLEQVLGFAHEAGFSSVELMCWPPGKSERRYAGVSHIDATNLSAAAIEQVKKLLAKYHVSISGLGYYPNLLVADHAEAAIYAAHLRAVIDAAAALGVGVVNSFIGRDPALSVEANWPRFLEVWRPLIAHAESKGIKIGIENCPMLFTGDEWPGGKNLATTPAIWRKMFHDIPSPNFGLNFDPSHLIWQQIDYIAPVAEFKDRIFHVHAKDARIDRHGARSARRLVVSQTVAHAQDPGTGRRPLGPILRRLDRCRLYRARRHRSRRSSVRGLARSSARIAHHQPAVFASVLCWLVVRCPLSVVRLELRRSPPGQNAAPQQNHRSRTSAVATMTTDHGPRTKDKIDQSVGSDSRLQRSRQRRAAARRARRCLATAHISNTS